MGKMDLMYQDLLILRRLLFRGRTLESVYRSIHRRCGVDLYSTEARLKAMEGFYVEQSNGKYMLTVEGKSVLLYEARDVRRSIFLPIVVTLLTNLVLHGMQWLLPLIQQWLSSFRG